jgi:Fe-S cluster biogenesis protein NfuA
MFPKGIVTQRNIGGEKHNDRNESIEALLNRLRKDERIATVLNRIRPLLRADGVDLELVEVRDDGASVRLTGLRVRCGTVPLNVHTGLEVVLHEEIEGFGDLRLVTDGDVPRPRAAKADLGSAERAKKAS